MSGRPTKISHAGRLRNRIRCFNALLTAVLLTPAMIPLQTVAETITNLQQLVSLMDVEPRVVGDVDLKVTVCAASRPEIGVVLAQDSTGLEPLELGPRSQVILPGDRIEIQEQHCLLCRRDLGVKLSAVPVVDNDGVHIQTNRVGEIMLAAGRHPLELDWFNQFLGFALDVTCQRSNAAPEKIPGAWLSHLATDESSGRRVFQPGLRVECYEGLWENMPDFELLQPVKTGVTTNFDLQFRAQNEMVGLRFTGFFEAPYSGKYTFSTRSDDGSLLFIGDPEVKVSKLGTTGVPVVQPAVIGEVMTNRDERRWVSVEGSVYAVHRAGKGLELELRSERDSMQVNIADATGLDPMALLHSDVRVTGVGRGVFNLEQRIVLGQLVAASTKELKFLDTATGMKPTSLPFVTARQVQTLRLKDARRSLPVRIRGVVTSVGRPYDHWLSIQDNTRGIFVDTHAISNAAPACGEYWEITGHSGAGDFAPIVVADRATRLGEGRLPDPARPAWNELINGSMDVQWVEFQGLVTDVKSNALSMLLTGGPLTVQMQGYYESELKRFKNSVVRIQGVLFAAWKTGTRELQVGRIVMHNASVNVDIPAPVNPFDAIVKTPRQLLLFDAQATAFRRVKVRG